MNAINLSRRSLFALSGGALFVGFGLPREAIAQAAAGAAKIAMHAPKPDTLSSWIAVQQNGDVLAFFGKVDVGRNYLARLIQELPMCQAGMESSIGELSPGSGELGVDVDSASAEESPFEDAESAVGVTASPCGVKSSPVGSVLVSPASAIAERAFGSAAVARGL